MEGDILSGFKIITNTTADLPLDYVKENDPSAPVEMVQIIHRKNVYQMRYVFFQPIGYLIQSFPFFLQLYRLVYGFAFGLCERKQFRPYGF